MRIAGVTQNGAPTQQVILRRGEAPPIVLRVRAFALGEEARPYALFAIPEAPRAWVVDKKGMPLRDPETGEKQWRAETENPQWQEIAVRQSRRQAALRVYLALRSEPSIEWETPKTKPLDRDPEAFADGIWSELDAAGFTTGDVRAICDAAERVSNIGEEALKRSRPDFLSEAERGAAANAPT